MAQIRTDTWCVDNIVEGELIDKWGCLEEEGKRLRSCQRHFRIPIDVCNKLVLGEAEISR